MSAGTHKSFCLAELVLIFFNYSPGKCDVINVHGDQDTDAHTHPQLIYRVLLMIAASNRSTVGLDFQVIYSVLTSM